jgi:selenide,water dikinase
MLTLNRIASEIMVETGAHACTDITGFGFIGHAAGMAKASGVTFSFDSQQIPILEGALDYASQGFIPGGAYNNEKFYSPRVKLDVHMPQDRRMVFYDPQTSGGLLISIEKNKADALLRDCRNGGTKNAVIVGEVINRGNVDVIIR